MYKTNRSLANPLAVVRRGFVMTSVLHGWNYLSMSYIHLNHVSKRGPWNGSLACHWHVIGIKSAGQISIVCRYPTNRQNPTGGRILLVTDLWKRVYHPSFHTLIRSGFNFRNSIDLTHLCSLHGRLFHTSFFNQRMNRNSIWEYPLK